MSAVDSSPKQEFLEPQICDRFAGSLASCLFIAGRYIKKNDMSHFDDLPNRNRNHVTEDKAIAAFQKRLSESDVFILQSTDRKDYGTDCTARQSR